MAGAGMGFMGGSPMGFIGGRHWACPSAPPIISPSGLPIIWSPFMGPPSMGMGFISGINPVKAMASRFTSISSLGTPHFFHTRTYSVICSSRAVITAVYPLRLPGLVRS